MGIFLLRIIHFASIDCLYQLQSQDSDETS